MQVKAIKVPRVQLNDPMAVTFEKHMPPIKPKTVVAVTSKLVSLWQGRFIPASDGIDKAALIQREADAYIELEDHWPHVQGMGHMTLVHHMMVPASGIDESNVPEPGVLLLPRDPFAWAEKIAHILCDLNGHRDIAVLLTDSRSLPLRRGVTGCALAWYGLEPMICKQGERDLYGRPLQSTVINVVDALAAPSVWAMGEGSEQTPIALIQDVPHIVFTRAPASQDQRRDFFMPFEEDIYYPIWSRAPWIYNQSKK